MEGNSLSIQVKLISIETCQTTSHRLKQLPDLLPNADPKVVV